MHARVLSLCHRDLLFLRVAYFCFRSRSHLLGTLRAAAAAASAAAHCAGSEALCWPFPPPTPPPSCLPRCYATEQRPCLSSSACMRVGGAAVRPFPPPTPPPYFRPACRATEQGPRGRASSTVHACMGGAYICTVKKWAEPPTNSITGSKCFMGATARWKGWAATPPDRFQALSERCDMVSIRRLRQRERLRTVPARSNG
jgi:hypothetical protein